MSVGHIIQSLSIINITFQARILWGKELTSIISDHLTKNCATETDNKPTLMMLCIALCFNYS